MILSYCRSSQIIQIEAHGPVFGEVSVRGGPAGVVGDKTNAAFGIGGGSATWIAFAGTTTVASFLHSPESCVWRTGLGGGGKTLENG